MARSAPAETGVGCGTPLPGRLCVELRQVAARIRLRPVTIRLPAEDLDAARGLAAQKGIGYQTYIRMLLREALRREARR